jgi:hypothetical protein
MSVQEAHREGPLLKPLQTALLQEMVSIMIKLHGM